MTQNHLFWRRLILLGAPLALGILDLTHPIYIAQTGVFGGVGPRVDWWITLHIIQLPLIGLIALAVYLLVAGLPGWQATVSRLALVIFFVPFYSAWDAVAGVGTGVLIRYANSLPAVQQAAVEPIIDAYWQSQIFGNISIFGWLGGSLGWIVAVLAAAIALAHAGAPRRPLMLLIPAALLFGLTHVAPFGPLGMLCFFLAALDLERRFTGRRSTLTVPDLSTSPPPAFG